MLLVSFFFFFFIHKWSHVFFLLPLHIFRLQTHNANFKQVFSPSSFSLIFFSFMYCSSFFYFLFFFSLIYIHWGKLLSVRLIIFDSTFWTFFFLPPQLISELMRQNFLMHIKRLAAFRLFSYYAFLIPSLLSTCVISSYSRCLGIFMLRINLTTSKFSFPSLFVYLLIYQSIYLEKCLHE